jgi:cobalt-zinc-cadmium efflux system membrane fusion protein
MLTLSVVWAQDNHDHDQSDKKQAREEYNHNHHNDCEGAHEYESNIHLDDTESNDHNDHGEEFIVTLTTEAIDLAGITFSEVKHGRIEKTVELSGEIRFNEDRLAHISPRFAGVALQANHRVGDYVEEGSVVAIIESNESMNPYSITAPISGWVIDRHITRGEYVSEDNSIYVIADLSTVWINLAVYPKDANRIKKGQTALIKSIGTSNMTTGKIEHVMPIMDLRTRSATARITLSNSGNTFRPGSFVQATITTEACEEALVVEKNAVQYLEEKSVVFVVDELDRFIPVEVVTGDSDDFYTQIKSGLIEGVKYVSTGAFELKAKIVTSNLDAHAGHGH